MTVFPVWKVVCCDILLLFIVVVPINLWCLLNLQTSIFLLKLSHLNLHRCAAWSILIPPSFCVRLPVFLPFSR